MASTRKAGLGINHVAPVLSTLAEKSRIFLVSQLLRNIGKHCIVIRVLKRARYLFIFVKSIVDRVFKRNVSIFDVGVETATSFAIAILLACCRHLQRIPPHEWISAPYIEAADTFCQASIIIAEEWSPIISEEKLFHAGKI